ncbi:hypothetical protein Pcinc_037786 [Petrolisthes cinctipes]|uniref:Uncharacterized protein n=1 Tax=Petrolisthes cinctipes TaxID=88211 RepID=A0AAE1ENM3_PETCI|nr:hypothetical protein Pcinc_037786 [Petrolisthes cinctipes]
MGQPFSPPVLSERPQTSTELQQLETQEPHLFPLCAVTRSMAKSRQALESNQAGSSGGESLAEEQTLGRLCHINTLKQYHSREPPDTPPDSSVPVCAADVCLVDSQHEEEEDVSPITLSSVKTWQSNSATMQEKLEHLQHSQKTEVLDLLYKYPSVFKNEPGRTTVVAHDIEVGSASPIKQAPYRVHPSRVNQMMSELADMESLGVIEPSQELRVLVLGSRPPPSNSVTSLSWSSTTGETDVL